MKRFMVLFDNVGCVELEYPSMQEATEAISTSAKTFGFVIGANGVALPSWRVTSISEVSD